MIENSTVFITGGAGFIGSTLANALLENNKVVVLDDLSMGNFDNLSDSDNLTKILGSVTNKELLGKILEEYNFDYIFHLAAVASVADSVARPYETHQVNFDSTMSILEYLRTHENKLKRLVFSSSAAVYGDEPTLPKKEESAIRPLTPYAIDKFSSERMAMVYNKLYGIPTSAARFFNVYGPKQNPKSPYSGFISILVDRLKNGTELTIFGDGEQSRDFVYVADVIQAMLIIAESNKSYGEVFNVGTGHGVSLNDLIFLSQELTGDTLKITHGLHREGDIKKSISDITKLTNIGYKPKFNLQEGLRLYLEDELRK